MVDTEMGEGRGAPDDAGPQAGTLFPTSVGERLRAARIAAGLELQEVASKTRVPTRHLEAIERSDYAGLPSTTYAIGFARSYARAVGADETTIARDLRIEFGRAPADVTGTTAPYQPVDTTRVPSRLLAYTALALLVVLLAGYLFWRNAWSSDAPVSSAALSEQASPALETAPVLTPAADAAVVLTATAPVWVRIYDRSQKTLFEAEMRAGEAYYVPADADAPMILTGRPDVLKVTVDGQAVAPLSRSDVAIRDVGISAAALRARVASATATPATPKRAEPRAVTRNRTRDRAGAQALESDVVAPSQDTSPVAAPPPTGNISGN